MHASTVETMPPQRPGNGTGAGTATAIAVVLVQTDAPCMCDVAVSMVLATWRKEGHVRDVITQGYSGARGALPALVAIAKALPPHTPIIAVCGNTTTLVHTDWEAWEARWLACPRWLWCTGVELRSGAALLWHKDVTLTILGVGKGDCKAGPLPAWGVLGGTACSLLACLDVWPAREAPSMDASIARAWLAGDVHVDDTVDIAHTMRMPWHAPPSVFTGSHARLQAALGATVAATPIPRSTLWLGLLHTASCTPCWLRIAVCGIVLAFFIVLLIVAFTRRKP